MRALGSAPCQRRIKNGNTSVVLCLPVRCILTKILRRKKSRWINGSAYDVASDCVDIIQKIYGIHDLCFILYFRFVELSNQQSKFEVVNYPFTSLSDFTKYATVLNNFLSDDKQKMQSIECLTFLPNRIRCCWSI